MVVESEEEEEDEDEDDAEAVDEDDADDCPFEPFLFRFFFSFPPSSMNSINSSTLGVGGRSEDGDESSWAFSLPRRVDVVE